MLLIIIKVIDENMYTTIGGIHNHEYGADFKITTLYTGLNGALIDHFEFINKVQTLTTKATTVEDANNIVGNLNQTSNDVWIVVVLKTAPDFEFLSSNFYNIRIFTSQLKAPV